MTYDFMLMGYLIIDEGKPMRCEAYFKTEEGDREPTLVYVKMHRPYQKFTPEGLQNLGSFVELKLSLIVKGGETDGNGS